MITLMWDSPPGCRAEQSQGRKGRWWHLEGCKLCRWHRVSDSGCALKVKSSGLMGRVGWGCGGEKNEGDYEAAAWVDGGAMP